MKRLTTARIFIAVCLLCTAAVLLVQSTRDRPLHECARLVEKADSRGRFTRIWLTNERYAGFRWIKRGVLGVPRNDFYIYTKDLRTGRETAVIEPVQKEEALFYGTFLTLSRGNPSRDGRRALASMPGNRQIVEVHENAPPFRTEFAVTVPATQTPLGGVSAAWGRDGRELLTLVKRGTRAYVVRFAAADGGKRAEEEVTLPAWPMACGLRMIGTTEAGDPVAARAVASGWNGEVDAFVLIQDSGRKVTTIPWKRPPGLKWQADGPRVSPLGDKLAWNLGFEYRPSVPNMLSRLFPFLRRDRPRKTREIWVSRIDGTEMRRVGWVDEEIFAPLSNDGLFLDWSPDGREIFFTYERDLYAIPVD